MALSPNFVPSHVRNICFLIPTAGIVVGWILERGIFIRSVELYIGSEVTTTNLVRLGMAMGNAQPTTVGGVEAMALQLFATTELVNFNFLWSRMNMTLQVGQFARAGYDVLAILAVNNFPITQSTCIASLVVDPRLKLSKKQLM